MFFDTWHSYVGQRLIFTETYRGLATVDRERVPRECVCVYLLLSICICVHMRVLSPPPHSGGDKLNDFRDVSPVNFVVRAHTNVVYGLLNAPGDAAIIIITTTMTIIIRAKRHFCMAGRV